MGASEANTPLLDRVTDYVGYYAARRPDADFLLHEEVRLTYGEAIEWIDACAGALLSSGVGPGDRVAAYGTPRPEFFLTFLAAASIGAVWLGLNPKYTPEELAHNVGDASPKILFGLLDDPGQDAVLSRLAADQASIEQLVSREPSSVGMTLREFLELGQAADPERLEEAREGVSALDAAALVYTSGSTGRPKGALLPHRGLAYCSLIQNEHWVTFDPLRVLCDLPINHIGALGDICCSTLVAGGALYFMEKFNASALLGTIERERLTMWGAVPTMLLLATQTAEWRTAELSSLRRIIWSGAAATEELLRELEGLEVCLSSSYGMTETVGSVTYTADDDPLEVKLNTIGRPDPRYEVRVARPDGSACEVEEEGEILVRADSFVMLGYLNRPDATAERIRDGWLHTGDSAVVRADGNIRLVGRLSDMFKSGGYNVYCREVEIALERHPAVALAAVVGVPDPLYGEVGLAFLLSGAGPIEETALREFARLHLANYKVPKRLMFVDDLPRLAIGKVDKPELRRRGEAMAAQTELGTDR